MLNVEKLYELMQEKDVPSVAQLSRDTNIPYSTLSYMISGHDMYVGTMIELSRYFNVPIDHLINKNFGIVTYSEDSYVYTETSSIVEATVSSMM